MLDTEQLISDFTGYIQNMRTLGDYDVVVERMTTLTKIQNLVPYFLGAVELSEDERTLIHLIVVSLQEIYNNGGEVVSPISDDDYDKIYELNRKINDEEVVGASVGVRNKPMGFHKYPALRGTLDKRHFVQDSDILPGKREHRRSIEEWLRSCENRLGRKMTTNETRAELFAKFDGNSVIFELNEDAVVERALSRGDTVANEAVDYTALFKGTSFSYIPEFEGAEHGLKTEVVMSEENFKRLCNDHGAFKSPRSAVSAILNMKDLDTSYLTYLTIVPLQAQRYGTPDVFVPSVAYTDYPNVPDVLLCDPDALRDAIDYIRNKINEEYGVPIDGIVIRLTDPEIQEYLDRDDAINKFEVAYKFQPNMARTFIRDVIFSYGVFGTVTPVAIVDKVKLDGNTIDSPSLGSIELFEARDLREGDEVIIMYNIVPYLTVDETCKRNPDGMKFVTPTHCPHCGEPLIKDPVLRCGNLNCKCRVVGKIANYVEKMKIPEISIGTITVLHNAGFLNTIEDLYRLKNHERELAMIPRFGNKSIKKMLAGIDSRRDVLDYELLGSIGIPNIGRRIFKKILNIYHIPELIQISSDNDTNTLTKIGGIMDLTAEKIMAGIRLNLPLIQFLRSELNVKREEAVTYTMSVYLTDVRDAEFQAFLERNGINTSDSFSKKTDVLIVPSNSTSNKKTEKAEKWGTAIMTLENAYRSFGYKL